MTINTPPTRLSYDGDGTTTAFPITWEYIEKSHVVATLRDSNGTETSWVLATDYTLTDAGVDAGGTLTATTAPASGETLVIDIFVPHTQVSPLPLGGDFPSDTVEKMSDLDVQRTGQLESKTNRAMLVPTSDSQVGNMALPIDDVRKTKVQGYDADGKPRVTSSTVDDIDAIVATGLQTGQIMQEFNFTGDGVTTGAPLYVVEGLILPSRFAAEAYFDGIRQSNNDVSIDTNTQSGDTIFNFDEAPPNQAKVSIKIIGYSKPFATGDASGVSFVQSGVGAVARTVEGRLRERLSIFDFIPPSEHAAIIARNADNGHGADINKAIAAAISENIGTIEVPSGDYHCDIPLLAEGGGLTFEGKGGDLNVAAANTRSSRFLIQHSGTGLLVNPNAGMFNSEFADGATNLLRGFVIKNMSFAAGDVLAGSGAPQAARGVEIRNTFEQVIMENCSFRGFTFLSAFFNNCWNVKLMSCTARGGWPPDSSINGVYGFLGYNANSIYAANSYVSDAARTLVGFRWMGAEAGTMVACQTDQVGSSVWIDDNIGKFALNQHWVERCRQRYPGQVVAYEVTNGGSGYTSAPTVTIGAPGVNGVQATAVSSISGGAVTKVLAFNPGSDYSSAPSVTFSGGGGSSAAATAIITDNNTGSDMVAPLLIATNCEGIKITSGHLIWGGDPTLGETIQGSTSHVWAYNATDVELENTKLIGGGLTNDGVMVAVARSGSDRIRVYDSCRVDRTGFRAIGRQNEADGTFHIPYDDEFGALEFPDDWVKWLPAKDFDICNGTPTFAAFGTTPDQSNAWNFADGVQGGVQVHVNLPQHISRQNRVLTPTIHFATSTGGSNVVQMAARPVLLQADSDVRVTSQVFRDRTESATANGLRTATLTTTANWSVALSNADRAINMSVFRGATDTSTGILYLLGVELRIQKADWES